MVLAYSQISRKPTGGFHFPNALFGVLLSGLILGEAITFLLGIGLALVAGGIYLVNRPQPVTTENSA